jgi:hypothetical protein
MREVRHKLVRLGRGISVHLPEAGFMNAFAYTSLESLNDSLILPSQFNDLVRRRSVAPEGEYRLLIAVLEDAIRIYIANMNSSTHSRRIAFEEVRMWFKPVQTQAQALFAFETICDLLGINSGLLLERLESVRISNLPSRRHRVARSAGLRRLKTPQRNTSMQAAGAAR